jgi:hypothetical protein
MLGAAAVMEASNPYEAPRSGEAADEPPVDNPVLAELMRSRPWATAAGVSIAVASVALAAVAIAGGGSRGNAGLSVVGFLIGGGLLSARLLILARTIRAAAAPPHHLDLCFRDIRKVFSHPGVIVAVLLALLVIALLFVVGRLALPGRT